MAKSGSKDLERLVRQLAEAKPTDYSSVSFQGRALSRGDDALHVAVETGIVEIPLNAIDGVRQIYGRGPDELWIDVLDVSKVTHIRVVPDPFTDPCPSPFGGNPLGADGGTKTRECNGIDTTCASGGVADATDDYRQYCYTD